MEFPYYALLGVKIAAVQFPQIIAQMGEWIQARSLGHSIVVANTHILMERRVNAPFKAAIDAASMVIPDGMPLIIAGRARGFVLPQRAYGPDLLMAALAASNGSGWRHYFYGSTPEILEQMRNKICEQWPGVIIAGVYSPPFRALSDAEDQAIIDQINRARPDILWVGLGCPKQECWIADHQSKLAVPVMLGVGQAFDILAGAKSWAPKWMRSNGLEWLYRLVQEPRRLWKRYLVYAPQFVFLAAREQLGYWWSTRK